jgi:hypothetical protein
MADTVMPFVVSKGEKGVRHPSRGYFMGRDCGSIEAMEDRYGVYDGRRGA